MKKSCEKFEKIRKKYVILGKTGGKQQEFEKNGICKDIRKICNLCNKKVERANQL